MASFCRTGSASIVLIIRKDPTGKEVFQRNMVICWIVTFFRYVLEEFTGTVIGFEIKQVETRNRFIPIFFPRPQLLRYLIWMVARTALDVDGMNEWIKKNDSMFDVIWKMQTARGIEKSKLSYLSREKSILTIFMAKSNLIIDI